MMGRKASGLRPILEAESGNGAKGPIIGHEHRVVLQRMGRDEQVERAERFSTLFEFRADCGVSPRGPTVPRHNFDRRQELIDGDAKLSGLRPFGDPKEKLGFCHHRKADALGRLGRQARHGAWLSLQQRARCRCRA
jgi:hypothetical protein